MSGLILPPQYQKQQEPSMGISSNIMLNDSELKALLDGPVAWANSKAGQRMNIDAFAVAFREKIEALGFTVEIKCYDTNEPGVYSFEAEINGRQRGSVFDPDRQVHEVTNNLLGLKGEETGFIKTKDGVAMLEQREKDKSHKNH